MQLKLIKEITDSERDRADAAAKLAATRAERSGAATLREAEGRAGRLALAGPMATAEQIRK